MLKLIVTKLESHLVFWWRWLRAPLKVGAIAPSGPFLTRRMAAQVNPHHPGWVIELGAGSGVVTRALLQRGIKPERIMIIEIDRRFCRFLEAKFPGVRVVHGSVEELDRFIKEHHVHKINAIVSSLPLMSFPPPLYRAAVTSMLQALCPESHLIQFTYSPTSPIRSKYLKQNGISTSKVGRIWFNIPPATVWRYNRA